MIILQLIWVLTEILKNLQVPGHEATDPVILLVSSVFRLAEVEKRAAEAGFSSLLRKD